MTILLSRQRRAMRTDRRPKSVTLEPGRLTDRRQLLAALEAAARRVSTTAAARQMSEFQQQAFELLQSRQVHDACDLEREETGTCERYGRHLFG